MWKLRFALGLIALLTGVVLAVIAGIDGRFWGAAGFFAAGVSGAATVILWEMALDPSFWLIPVCGAALTCFSVVDVFTSSHAVNSKEIAAQDDFIEALINLKIGTSPLGLKEKQLVEDAFTTCVLQRNRDQQELVLGAQKAIYFGSALTLADGVNSALTEQQPVRCLDYYRELRKTQANLFATLEKRHPWLLARPTN